MKAAVLYKPNTPLIVEELNLSSPKPGEVKVRMAAAGVCASDHHWMTGDAHGPMPIVLGHEGAAVVEEVGQGVTRVKPGDRCILSFVSSCGYCRLCRTGSPQLCDTAGITGATLFDGTTRLSKGETSVYQMAKVGVFSEMGVVPEQACHKMPDAVPFEVAALIGCSVTTGVGAVINNPASRPGSTVAVFGCGGVGLNVIQGAKLMGASRIIAVDIYNHKLEFTYKFGATDVINSKEVDAVEEIKNMTRGGVDLAFDSFGSAITTSAAVESLRKNGTAVLVGLAPVGAEVPINMVELVRSQKTLIGSYYGSASSHETFDKLIDWYLKGRLSIDELITRRYAIDEINEGFDALSRGEDGRGVIIF
ncbi:MAG: Zn-dependent alcohol dehydrogenase [Chloroflexota bacterium]|jgi:S-(hydroxymethyl)glutathione dehydrogenase/alcohol dehydrogenase